MSDPIRAALEAAAIAIEATMFAPHELPLDVDLHRKYLDTTRAGIVAFLRALPDDDAGVRGPTFGLIFQAVNALADTVEKCDG